MISEQAYNSFFTIGYLRLPAMIPLPLLNRLKELFDELMVPDSDTEKVIIENKGKKYVTNLENICSKDNLACLELLGYPPILDIAENICGKYFF